MEQGMGLPAEKKCFPAAYNAPASIAVSCGWDFDVSASFLYWYVSEEGLTPGLLFPESVKTADSFARNGTIATQDFNYKPGFQLAVGYNTGYDNWVGWAEYTWMHQSVSSSNVLPPALLDGAAGSWSLNNWYLASPVPATTPGNSLSTGWKMHMDMLDVCFSRPYYEGTQLTVSPYAGLRALWIRQAFNVTINDPSTGSGSTYLPYPTVRAKSNSWAIGPVTGVMGHWLLGMGFRLEGNATGALLYTQYTTIDWKETAQNDSPGMLASQNDLAAIRPVAQLGVGLGYGSYLFCQKYYIDFSARYDFNLFWNQNAMRTFASQLSGLLDGQGSLMMHGLTLNGRFDF